MIVSFSFENFRSFRQETNFDFQAAAIPEFDDCIIKRDNVSSLLPVSAVYGPNGGGKSNLLMALAYLISVVTDPIKQLGKNRVGVFQQRQLNCDPFLFDDSSKQNPSVFDLYFRTEENEFRYYFSVMNEEVIDECLYRKTYKGKKTAMLFERHKDKIVLGDSIRKKSINTDVNPKMPYLSFLSINYNIPVIVEAQKWFESCMIKNYANYLSEKSIYIPEEEVTQLALIQLVNDMDIDVDGFRVDKETDKLFFIRNIDGKEYELEFQEESAGTKKVFSIIPSVLIAIAEGRLVVFDELDAKLHPKLLKYIIFLFKNPQTNKKGAQLLFTSHDLTTMNHDVFRRDEIWFAALNHHRESEIYSLYDFRTEDGNHVNNTASYSKQYLEGRYGADPYLRNMLDWEALE